MSVASSIVTELMDWQENYFYETIPLTQIALTIYIKSVALGGDRGRGTWQRIKYHITHVLIRRVLGEAS